MKKNIRCAPALLLIVFGVFGAAVKYGAGQVQDVEFQLKQASLYIGDGENEKATIILNDVLKKFSRDVEVRFRVVEYFVQMQKWGRAHVEIEKCIATAATSEQQKKFAYAALEINHNYKKETEKRKAELKSLIDAMDYSRAFRSLDGLESNVLIAADTVDLFLTKAGLLGYFRQYADAREIYDRLISSSAVPDSRKVDINRYRGLCARAETEPRAGEDASGRRCYFCGARITPGDFYCPRCLSLQAKIQLIEGKNTTVRFRWQGDALASVNFRYYNDHFAGNLLMSILGGLSSTLSASAAAKGYGEAQQIPVTFKEADELNRHYDFLYNGRTMEKINFSYENKYGGKSINRFVSYGTSEMRLETDQKIEAKQENLGISDSMIYPDNPVVDARFAQEAFGQNAFRGVSLNQGFWPFEFTEPHSFVLYYDEQGRVKAAVDCYNYDYNEEDQLILTKKPFIGAGRIDPLTEKAYHLFSYGADGRLSQIQYFAGGACKTSRNIFYSNKGIQQEDGYVNGKLVSQIQYLWTNGQLTGAKYFNKADDTFSEVQFAPPFWTSSPGAVTSTRSTVPQAASVQRSTAPALKSAARPTSGLNVEMEVLSALAFQYAAALESKTCAAYFRDNATQECFESIKDELEGMLAEFDRVKSTVGNFSTKFSNNGRNADLYFDHILTAVFRPTKESQMLYEGIVHWKLLKDGQGIWKIWQIAQD